MHHLSRDILRDQDSKDESDMRNSSNLDGPVSMFLMLDADGHIMTGRLLPTRPVSRGMLRAHFSQNARRMNDRSNADRPNDQKLNAPESRFHKQKKRRSCLQGFHKEQPKCRCTP